MRSICLVILALMVAGVFSRMHLKAVMMDDSMDGSSMDDSSMNGGKMMLMGGSRGESGDSYSGGYGSKQEQA